MKNLSLWDVKVRVIREKFDDNLPVCFNYDEHNGGDLYVSGLNLSVTCYGENCNQKWELQLSQLVSPINKVVNMTYLSLPSSLCVGFSNGELFTIGDSGNNHDMAGVCNSGILAMEWSPDQELLTVVTKDLNMILMSCMFDPIHEVNLLDGEFGEKQFITVGWGKKETQFHGSEGKQAAKAKSEIISDPSTTADSTVKITWRGDGNLYAVGFVTDGIRQFKVFDREGHLQFTSEREPGLEANLAWRPSGNVIATTQKLQDKYAVAFFEKNGLKHGGFTIPVNSSTNVKNLMWNSDSEILALHCENFESNTEYILLFTTSNYHWYLKQTLKFTKHNKISNILWDTDFEIVNNKKLNVFLQNGSHYTYSWVWNIDHSIGKDNNDNATVAVIDGQKILVTGFRQTVVAPPMAALEINVDTPINSVHFVGGENDPNSFFLLSTDNKLIFYDLIHKFPLKYELINTISNDHDDVSEQYYNWCWVKKDTVIAIMIDKTLEYKLVEFQICENKIEKRNIENLPTGAVRIQCSPDNLSTVYLQLNNGDIIKYKLGGLIKPEEVSFNSLCPKFSVVLVDNKISFLGLSHKGNLYVDNGLAMNSVSSIFIHTHFLLLTTLQHLLFSVRLNGNGINAIIEHNKNGSLYVYQRKIERGAKLVIAVPNDTRTIFQMPRGNLETIQPRPLSLKIIGDYLDNLQYYEAFDLMRKQRINLNLIYDHNPEKFIKCVDIFLESIKNNSWLNLFLSDLENIDVTKTMYSSSYYTEQTNYIIEENNFKVQNVCNMVREALMQRPDKDNKILPIITSFVKKNLTEDLEEALSLIKYLKEKETSGCKLPVSSDEALKFLLYMVDVNQLFNVALGMYDFDLVLLIASKSQKDPKEYIPMLNNFNEMCENYKRFAINKHLKRFDRAVGCLANCGPQKHDELRTFVKYHSLYRESLRLFKPQDTIYQQISEDFGLYLKLKKQYIQAGIIYERANNIEKAVDCYKDALEWDLALKLAKDWPEQDIKILCREIVDGLKEEKRHIEALLILEHFYKNDIETISYAIDCGQYRTALRLCSNNKIDLKDKILNAVVEEYKKLQDQIEINWNTFIRHKDRLVIIRKNNKQDHTEAYDPDFINKDSDLFSDAGSTLASSQSRGSSRTYRSSKNRRKHERKIASLKEGSQYEDVALVMALHNLVTASFDLRLAVKEVITALSCLDKDKEALILQKSLEKLLKEMKDNFKDIWTNELMIEAVNASIAAQNVPEGFSIILQGIASLEPHLRIAPIVQEIDWKLDGLN